jgi:hypothetical protein
LYFISLCFTSRREARTRICCRQFLHRSV